MEFELDHVTLFIYYRYMTIGKSSGSKIGQIEARIREKGRGSRFTSADFRDIGDPSAVRVTLFRLVRAGKIRRLARGIFDLPRVGADGSWIKTDPLMKATLTARPHPRRTWLHDPFVSWSREAAAGYGRGHPALESSHALQIVILAGPNGAGKTTFAREYLPREAGCPVFVNVDLIAAGLSPFSPERAAFQAGKIMLHEIAEHVRRQESFAFETTLSGLGYARMIPRWRKLGFHVHLAFLSLPSADMAVARVAFRVLQGGHSIPEDVIRRRYEAGWRNFQILYRTLPDTWQVYDNAGPLPVMLENGENGS
jgi:predicted ABC-type ATPase